MNWYAVKINQLKFSEGFQLWQDTLGRPVGTASEIL